MNSGSPVFETRLSELLEKRIERLESIIEDLSQRVAETYGGVSETYKVLSVSIEKAVELVTQLRDDLRNP